MNRNIIIAIIIVVIIAVVGVFLFSHPADGKTNTQINFLSESTLKNGEQVQFELKDVQGNVISGQSVEIAYDDGTGNVQNFTITTDQNGKGFLTINDEDAGNYNVTVTFAGNEKYNGCSAKQPITIEGDTADASTEPSQTQEQSTTNSSAGTSTNNNQESSSDSQQSNLHYNSQYNFYYDDDGVIRGGQSDGSLAQDVIDSYESGDMVDEEGNLQ